MELRDAFNQITAIRTQLAAADRLRGLRAVPVAFSGGTALVAALAQSLWITDPLVEPRLYLTLWLGAAMVSMLAAGTALLLRVRHSGSRLGIANAVLAVQLFAPCLLAGAVVTAFVATRLPDQLWLLPGLWQIFYSLGIIASHRLLPAKAFAIGAFYFASGTLILWFGHGSLAPWAMGLPFGAGQLALAAVLWWHYERKTRRELP